MKILITGGAGFIGLHLAQKLIQKNFEVHLVDNFERGILDQELKAVQENKLVKLFALNLMDNSSYSQLDKDYDYIFHFAAIIGVTNVEKRPYDVLKNNTILLANIIDHARNQKALKRIVFTSTSEVVIGTLEANMLEIPTPETSMLALTPLDRPRTSYMLSKIYGEAMCIHSQLPYTILRPHNFYGPRMGMNHVIPELLLKAYRAQEGSTLEVFSVDHKRTFCFVSDAVEFIFRASQENSCLNQVLNLGSENPMITIGEVAETILKIVKKKLKIVPLAGHSGSPLLRCPNMKKTIRLTGYEAQISLEQGIQKTYNWYLQNDINFK